MRFSGLLLYVLPLLVQAACEIVPSPLAGNTVLDADCVYHQSIVIDRPVTLDCRGAVLDGQDLLPRGLVIDSRGGTLAGVTVRNCTFRNFSRAGILVHWGLPNDEKMRLFPDLPDRRARTPHDILITQVRVEGNRQNGIVLDDEVHDVTLAGVSVINNPGWGLYWDRNASHNVLIDSEVRHNGHGSNKPGLSIDAASHNRVLNTVFEDNRRSAIELYRNCWEFAASHPHSVPRETGANDNLIEGNHFRNERIGVWIAARQSKDLRAMQCGRPAYYAGRYVEDEALRNVITGNDFETIAAYGVIVEDDDNEVSNNRFAAGAHAIRIGSSIRSRVLGRPVIRTRLQGNRAADGQEPVHFLAQ
jgi:hypothetical protein